MKRTVGFSIDMQWFTQIVRDTWAEGRYGTAINLLESSGCPVVAHYDIIRGVKQIVGDENEAFIRSDQWTPPDDRYYPDPGDIPALAENAQRWKDVAFRYMRSSYYRILDELRRGIGIYGRDDIANLIGVLRSYPQEFRDSLPPEDQVELAMLDMTSERRARRRVQQYLNHQSELDSRPAPDPTEPQNSRHGWILPDGKFYLCGWMEHDWLAFALGASTKEAEDAGWIRVGFSSAGGDSSIQCLSHDLTQPQIDALWDWCDGNDVAFPTWATR